MKTKMFTMTLLLTAMVSVIVIVQSCKKKIDGCTDSTAVNYNSSANENDGSCYYKGNATFWEATTDSLGVTTVTMGDGTSGQINVDVTGTPSCNAAGCFNYTNVPGTYPYVAVDPTDNLKWSGQITITSNGCGTLRLQ